VDAAKGDAIMRARNVWTAALIGAGLVACSTLTASPAAAASGRTSAQTLSAYSWNGYKATVWPGGWKVPKGYVSAGKTVSIASNGRLIARHRKSVSLSAGTYTAYSTFKYRSRTAYKAYRTSTLTADYTDSCYVESATITDTSETGSTGYVTATYTGKCSGTAYDANYDERQGSWRATWTRQESAWAYDPADAQPEYTVGERIYDDLPGGRFTYKTSYTAYRYGKVKAKHVHRTVTVRKVFNTSVMTRTEWHAFDEGDTLARVRKVVGSRGKLVYDGYLGTAYEWRNTSGGTTWVWFDGRYVDTRTWYGY
jgi:hypothetical protein